MARRRRTQVEHDAITPYMEKLDKQLLKIHYKLQEISASIKDLRNLYEKLDQDMDRLYRIASVNKQLLDKALEKKGLLERIKSFFAR